jgi:hypothetical protein
MRIRLFGDFLLIVANASKPTVARRQQIRPDRLDEVKR